MEEIVPIWYILTGDHIRLDTKDEGSAECSWQLFRWNDDITRIYY